MSLDKMKRRDFLKVMGWSGVGATLAGCDMPTTVTLEEGGEEVTSYLTPEEYVIPGIGVWYASTCQQCPAGCGLHGRVREGRVLKLEGNPDATINRGKLCQMGQGALQAHYNPDRLTKPLARKGGSLTEVSWDEAWQLLDQKVGAGSGLSGDRLAWVTDTISGHQAVLLDAFMEATGSSNHYVHETVNDAVWRAVARDVLGDDRPRLRLDKARVVLSFGADFLGTWGSPVHYANEYAEFRDSPRGVLIQAEPKMTLTGANADLWVPVRPGAEGVLALGIANVLATKHRHDISGLPAAIQQQIRKYDLNKVTEITGASGDHIIKTAALLKERSPSLVLAGASAEGHEHGYDNVAAVMLLNIMLGNVGKTIEPDGFPLPQLAAKTGGTRDLLAFARALEEERFDVVFFKGANNPVFTAPEALALKERLQGVPFKVALTNFEDETAQQADLVLPLYSAMEEWGTHVPVTQTERKAVSVQQPLMNPLYPETTRSFGDVMLALLKMRGADGYDGFEDYYNYLRNAFASLPAELKGGASDEAFWAQTLQKGMLQVDSAGGRLSARPVPFEVVDAEADGKGSYYLLPSARLGLWDGRHANIPWLQEAPDQISKVVWDSWAEMHPVTAAKLGVKSGDAVRITSEHGTIEAKAYVYKGIHPDAIAVPLGQGHEAYGRYAEGRGVNPMRILSPVTERKTGELAHHATRVQVARTGARDILVRLGGSETQVGRKLVATVTADRFERTEGDA